MKKKKLLNLGMLIISILIVLCGLAAAGSIKGWFSGEETLSISHRTGIVTVERSGLAYQIKEGNAIRTRDVISTNTSASLGISREGTPFLWLTDETKVSVKKEEPASFQVLKGEVFADNRAMDTKINLLLENIGLTAEQSVWSVSAQSGSNMVYVYAGKVSVTGAGEVETAAAGQVLSVVKTADGKENVTIRGMNASALNEFQMNRLLAAEMDDSFCFTEDDLEQVKQKRESEKLKAQQAKLLADSGVKASEASEESETEEDDRKENNFTIRKSKNTSKKTSQEENTEAKAQENQDAKEEDSDAKADAESKSPTKDRTEPEASEKPEQSKETEESKKPEKPNETAESQKPEEAKEPEAENKTEETSLYCTIEIRCDTILNNLGALLAGKEAYVPSDGMILPVSKVAFTQGETVFDVLKRACEIAGIQLEYSYTPMYESYYVEGIHQLYEFDCGSESGWMYKVNGWFPNYGCSGYTVKEGDEIVFCYTCNGLGADVGGSN